MIGEERKGCDPAGLIRWKLLLHQLPDAWLMRQGAVAEPRRISLQINRPAGQDVGEGRYVCLRIGGCGTDRVQFQALARHIFVQTAMGPQPSRAVGADRCRIVKIKQHCWMAHCLT